MATWSLFCLLPIGWPEYMKIQLRYFASIPKPAPGPRESLETSAQTAAQLLTELRARGGVYAQALAEGRPVRVAINQVMARADSLLCEGAEVGLFPPVTGG